MTRMQDTCHIDDIFVVEHADDEVAPGLTRQEGQRAAEAIQKWYEPGEEQQQGVKHHDPASGRQTSLAASS